MYQIKIQHYTIACYVAFGGSCAYQERTTILYCMWSQVYQEQYIYNIINIYKLNTRVYVSWVHVSADEELNTIPQAMR